RSLKWIEIGIERYARRGDFLQRLGRNHLAETRLLVEVQSRRNVVSPQRPFHRRPDDGIYRTFVLVLDFCFRRVDVDVDLAGVDINEEYVQRMAVDGQDVLIRVDDVVVEVGIPDETVVDEEILFAACLFRKLGLADKAPEIDNRGFLLQRHEALVIAIAKDVDNPLLQPFGRQVKKLVVLAVQAEEDIRVGQRQTLELVDDVPHFHWIALQKVTTGGHVIKKVLDAGRGPCRRGYGFLANDLGTLDNDSRS